MTDQLTVTVNKTANGAADYIQILSADTIGINIVLIAGEIKIEDHRISEPIKPKKGFCLLCKQKKDSKGRCMCRGNNIGYKKPSSGGG